MDAGDLVLIHEGSGIIRKESFGQRPQKDLERGSPDVSLTELLG